MGAVNIPLSKRFENAPKTRKQCSGQRKNGMVRHRVSGGDWIEE
jgi:hypothetical protein